MNEWIDTVPNEGYDASFSQQALVEEPPEGQKFLDDPL